MVGKLQDLVDRILQSGVKMENIILGNIIENIEILKINVVV